MNTYYIEERLSKNKSLLPNGCLLCKDVGIARTGVQDYHETEVGIAGDYNGIVKVERPEEEVFSPDAIKSFEGMPFTIDHPQENVTIENWRRYAAGFVTNVRRGSGNKRNLLIADIVISNKTAIDLIQNGMKEISCGYEADYEVTGKGKAKQTHIRGNHVALVTAGRCGSACSIQDRKMEDSMADKKSLKDRFFAKIGLAACRAIRDEGFEPIGPMDEQPIEKPAEEPNYDSRIRDLEERLAKLEGAGSAEDEDFGGGPDIEDEDEFNIEDEDENEDPEMEIDDEEEADPFMADEGGFIEEEGSEEFGDEDEEEDDLVAPVSDKCSRDSRFFSNVRLFLPTLEKRAIKDSCSVRRMCLSVAMQDAKINRAVKGLLGRKTLYTADRNMLNSAFQLAVELKRSSNNDRWRMSDHVDHRDSARQKTKNIYKTIQNINDKNKSFWGGK